MATTTPARTWRPLTLARVLAIIGLVLALIWTLAALHVLPSLPGLIPPLSVLFTAGALLVP